MIKRIYITLVCLTCFNWSQAQQYTENELRNTLDTMSKQYKGYLNEVQLNVTGVPLEDLVNSIALENNLNISVDPSLNQLISYNFYNAQVKDVLVFLYLNFEVEYQFVGSILSIQRRTKQLPKPPVYEPKIPDVTYNTANTFLSMDLKGDTLWRVAERITKLTGKNLVLQPEVRNKVVNSFIQNRPLEQALEMFGKANQLNLIKEEDFYTIAPDIPAGNSSGSSSKNTSGGNNKNGANPEFKLVKNAEGKLDVHARQVDIQELLMAAADETGVHYVIYTLPEGKTSLEMVNVTLDDLLNRVFSNTRYSYTKDENVYLIGELKQEGVRQTSLIRLENRTIESVKTVIPKELTTDLEISEFLELNGLIVSGGERKIEELRKFIQQIDVVVPMVQIDVMLMYTKSGSSVKTGLKAGLKDEPTVTQGEIFPGLDVQLGAQTINDLLNAINGFGVVNLGQVTENFYVSLSALESNNFITIESTPKVSTLNGHEATISIGETTYYQETQVNVQTSVTNQGVLQSRMWKSVDANLSVKIKPFVSADEHVTLTISVEQDDFSGKVDPASPPNISTQTFESLVRVKNGEVILLGGLEKKRRNDSGSGVPLLSRIPVLKWIFSSRLKDREKSKLHILIRPTVTY